MVRVRVRVKEERKEGIMDTHEEEGEEEGRTAGVMIPNSSPMDHNPSPKPSQVRAGLGWRGVAGRLLR